MSGFTAEWLALREPYDLAARNPAVRAAVTAWCKSAVSVDVVDLACGSGATVRTLCSHLPARQHWHLVDHDSELLGLACKSALANDVTLDAMRLDLSRELDAALTGPIDLITTSALLDLVSEGWLYELLHKAAVRALPIYAALTYDGRIQLSPVDPLDSPIVAAVNTHQRTDKGFGPALGPTAAPAAIDRLEALGYSIAHG
ncbi:MAG: class I SAM-dependent methyltransferase, partial [Bradyrhizobium sp.]|uniref:class I SAM-dependent methyltransferase n=1 Tax=Bradyrhizobium sp. TaxID=376 RepID=UPI001DE302BD